jgi:hypothetical protein
MKLKIKKRIRNNSNVKRLELAVEHKLFWNLPVQKTITSEMTYINEFIIQ